jgi:hypothetical protein
MPSGPPCDGEQRVRDPRVHAPLPARRGRALRRRERRLRRAPGVPRLGLLLQRAAGNALPRRRARPPRRQGALQRQVLGRRQRIVGLRRKHERRRIRHPNTASTSRRSPRTFDRSSWPRGRADTPPTATSAGRRGSSPDCRTYAAWASASTASPCTTTPTSVRRGGRGEVRRKGLVRRPAQGRPHREGDGRPLGHHDPLRSPSTARASSSTSGATGTGAAPSSARTTSSARRSPCATPCTRR